MFSVMAVIFGMLLTGCNSAANAPPPQRLVITGSSTIAPVVTEISRAYEARNPGTRIDIQTGGSSRGIADARQGLADIGMASRELKSSETDLQSHLLALDGIGIILHRENPLTMLSRDQIKDIYQGRTRNWLEIGGPDRSITVVNKAAGRSTLEVFLEHFGLDARDIRASVVIGDNEHGVKTVAGAPGAIGYVSIGAAEYHIERGAPLKLIPLDGVAANTDNVRSGQYPLSRELNLVTLPGTADGLPDDFIHFARSEAVHDIVRDFYLVPAN